VAIEVKNLGKSFGAFKALDGVDLKVADGELLALLGPSGSGKTTLLRIIAGLEWPDSGELHFDGENALSRGARERHVGFVFQHYALFRHMTVFENVVFGLRVQPRKVRKSEAEIRKRVKELLDLVQLDWLADRYPNQLSGGQRQRIALARALAIEPRILLLDEPFGALDAKVRKELRQWLRSLHNEIHVTSIFVTHDQEEALEVSDELVVINNGRIEQIGSPDELYDAPANDFVMSFLGPVTTLEGLLMRPHDIDVSTAGQVAGTTPGEVVRMLRVGFEVRLTVRPTTGRGAGSSTGQEGDVTVVLTRSHARELGIDVGSKVWLSANRGATSVARRSIAAV
jgi:sulfate/thiosulfate transport system ATP-binding protein